MSKLSRNPKKTRQSSTSKGRTRKRVIIDRTTLPDLRPSLSTQMTILFIGDNPGVQSSIQQHHYAHHSNLFWKLFNRSEILERVVAERIKSGIANSQLSDDKLLCDLITQECSAKDDFDLITYGIGFTGLSPRCTTTASQLTSKEKLAGIPRLLKDIEFSKPKHAAVIGKAIWETIVKYYCLKLGMKFIKLSKDNFKWGKVEVGSDERYNSIIELLYSQLPSGTAIYVFPNTSGLVASLSFQEKLQLWQNLAGNI